MKFRLINVYSIAAAKVFALGISLIFVGCESDNIRPSSRDPSCDRCFVSTIDNPVVSGKDEVAEISDGRGNFSFESVILTGWGISYQDFSLAVRAIGNESLGAVSTDDLVAVPILPVGQEVHAGLDSTVFEWIANGLELGYDFSKVVGVHRFAWFDERNTPPIPLRVRLDPNVLLVPVQQIRVLLATSESGEATFLRGISKRTYKKFWDDVTPFDTLRVYHPDKPNRGTRHAFVMTEGRIEFTRPDDVWKQCGIQFRMLDCGLPAGCPDLIVESRESIAPSSCEKYGIRDFLHMRENQRKAALLPGVNRFLPIILAVHKVSGSCFGDEPIDVAGPGWAAIAMSAQSDKLVVAHEMGHVLGLNDDFVCSDSNKHLMCAHTQFLSSHIRPKDCSRARESAARYVKDKWGVDVRP